MDQEITNKISNSQKQEDEVGLISQSQDQVQNANHLDRNSSTKRMILQQVNSLEGDQQKEDIFQSYLVDQNVKIRIRSSNNSQRSSSNQNCMEPQQRVFRRRSSSNKIVKHDCCCDGNCVGYHCPCLTQINQNCLPSQCCINCIKLKNQIRSSGQIQQNILQSKLNNTQINRPPCSCSYVSKVMNQANFVCTCKNKNFDVYMNPNLNMSLNTKLKQKRSKKNDQQTKNMNTCSCKKSHCLKKYCICFSLGQGCSPNCQCQQCLNTCQKSQAFKSQFVQRQRCHNVLLQGGQQQYEPINIDQYLQQQNFEEKPMPQSMQFDFPDIRNSYYT